MHKFPEFLFCKYFPNVIRYYLTHVTSSTSDFLMQLGKPTWSAHLDNRNLNLDESFTCRSQSAALSHPKSDQNVRKHSKTRNSPRKSTNVPHLFINVLVFLVCLISDANPTNWELSLILRTFMHQIAFGSFQKLTNKYWNKLLIFNLEMQQKLQLFLKVESVYKTILEMFIEPVGLNDLKIGYKHFIIY